jgi:hypothetical protein
LHILLASRIGKWTHGSGAASGIQDACCLGQVPVRATTGVTNAVRRGELAPCRLFSKCAVALDAKSATSAAGRAWHARIGYRRSIVERRRGCFETRAMRREPRRRKRLVAQDLQQSMGQGAIPPRIEGGNSNVSHQPWHGDWCAGPCVNSQLAKAGCGTRHIHCKGQTGRRFAAEITVPC